MFNKTVIGLTIDDCDSIIGHLQNLDSVDRRLRFFGNMSDEGLARYVERIDWNRDACFGVFDGRTLVAFAHVAASNKENVRELGISVNTSHRTHGLAKLLLDRVLTYCKANGIETLLMECLSSNNAMRAIAKKCGVLSVTDEETVLAQVAMKVTFGERMMELNKNIMYDSVALMDKSMREFHDRVSNWVQIK